MWTFLKLPGENFWAGDTPVLELSDKLGYTARVLSPWSSEDDTPEIRTMRLRDYIMRVCLALNLNTIGVVYIQRAKGENPLSVSDFSPTTIMVLHSQIWSHTFFMITGIRINSYFLFCFVDTLLRYWILYYDN